MRQLHPPASPWPLLPAAAAVVVVVVPPPPWCPRREVGSGGAVLGPVASFVSCGAERGTSPPTVLPRTQPDGERRS